jgi:4'-phosphopantetheinyl transferase
MDFMRVYLLDQRQAEVPSGNDWLCDDEIQSLNTMRFLKRRTDWRLGRWTAKCAVATCLSLPTSGRALARIKIRASTSGAPEVYLGKAGPSLTISLSHREGTALCAVARSGVQLGCDLELVEPHGDAFIADYFHPEEQALFARISVAESPRMVALLWSAKESVLKALHEGLRLDTRSVIVSLSLGACDLFGWSPFQVRCSDGQTFDGWSRSTAANLQTVVASPRPEAPICLTLANHFDECASLNRLA